MLCAIHQPNFFPWLGYFDKIRRADVFVFLDAVDYPRAGSGSMGSWLNRVKIAMNGEARWVGCPVRRMPLGSPIHRAVIDNSQPWRIKLLKSIEASYGRSRNYRETSRFLRELIERDTENLSEFNIACIRAVAKSLGVSVSFVRQSDLQVDGSATELLVNIARAVGAKAYLSGGGAQGYQLDEMFAANGIELVYQNYVSPIYRAPEKFISGLSIIDYLMHRQH